MFDDFTQSIDQRWTQTCIGGGSLNIVDSALRMEFASAQVGKYTDAQVDDYDGLTRSSHPAASATSTVESTNILRGTAGFGFWNYPFSVRGDVLMLPEATWFFYASPPSNMSLVPHVPGWGWKAQVVHSMRLETLASSVPMGVTAAWARLSGETRPAQRWMQKLTGAHEALLSIEMNTWHTYVLEWRHAEALFLVDGQQVLRAPQPPTRPLGFIAWLDNQYAVATPRGSFL